MLLGGKQFIIASSDSQALRYMKLIHVEQELKLKRDAEYNL